MLRERFWQLPQRVRTALVIVLGFLQFISGLFLPAILCLQSGTPCISGGAVCDISATFGELLGPLF
jgi:hypothetical protein